MRTQLFVLGVLVAVIGIVRADDGEVKSETAPNCYMTSSKDIYCTGCDPKDKDKCNTCVCPGGRCEEHVLCNTCEKGNRCRTCKIVGKHQECSKCTKYTAKYPVIDDGKKSDATCPPADFS